jgi:hypothetical protein
LDRNDAFIVLLAAASENAIDFLSKYYIPNLLAIRAGFAACAALSKPCKTDISLDSN